jgi:hypothetical protein
VLAAIRISVLESGELVVQGNIDDVVFAYGMLEGAKDAIRQQASRPKSPLLLPPAARLRPIPPTPGAADQVGAKAP